MAEVRAEMAGVVARILVPVGERVTAGQDLVVLEAMKMEIPLVAPVAGVVSQLLVAEGGFVQAGDLVAVVDS